ncbi:Alcohol dehydrogenase, iron-type [Metarhizium album ARSEF 1941]|uniref:Alcohol dehydrogenase, iron-type n=1 Tax=Metarhizium album (strain ARSEF 1941) TaxID=1081103 RepID=A0A0B2WND9_METAS|nr:Alcohol dehydrogenase, iron-type [Metarhizium album ARSEF 1941]KHN95473.1 Alcohol dehydrogenase, iron-type [Metarhizium album ARSEF 1941]
MNTIDISPTTGDPIAPTTSPTNLPPLAAAAGSHRRSHSVAIAGGSSTGVAAHRRAISSAGSGSATKARPSARSSGSGSSKSSQTEGSHSEPRSPRIVYGRGTIERLPTELGRLHASSPLIVSSPSRVALARRIQSLIPNLNSRILDSAVVNVPARVVDDAVSRIDDRDVVISVGGASAVGLAKAIGCRKGIPHVCIPTTYSGSEMMPLLLDAYPARHSNMKDGSRSTDSGNKSGGRRRREYEKGSSSCRRKGAHTTSFRDPKVLPSVIIYDEDLATSLPKRISAPTDAAAMALSTELLKEDETAQWSYIHLPGV